MSLAGVDLEKIADLNYGRVRLVVGAKDDDTLWAIKSSIIGTKIVCATEYPQIATNYLKGFVDPTGKRIEDPKVKIRGFEFGTSWRAIVRQTDGLTESYIEKGLANMILDNTQTGATLEKYDIMVGKVLLESCAGLYASKSALKDKEKSLKLRELADNLSSVVNAKSFDYIVFNIRKDDEAKLNNVLYERNAFASEPTIIEGKDFAQYNLQVPKNEFVSVISAIRECGAKDILVMQPRQIYRGG